MVYLFIIGGFLCAVVTTMLLIPLICRVAFHQNWVDKPDGERKLHARVTPTLGGVAIAGGYLVGMTYLALVRDYLPVDLVLPPWGIWVGALVMIGAGVYDDIRGLGFKRKFLIQVVVAYLLMHGGYRIDVSGLPFIDLDPYQQALFSIPLTMLWVVGVINAINLLDGLDGLAAGVSVIAFACLSLVFSIQGGLGIVLPALVIIGALAGFLVYNFNPASIFMGDSGSLFLGFMLAAYSLQGQAHVDPVMAFLILVVALGLPVLDASFSIVRRLINGKAIFSPDSDHIHHRMVRRWPQRRVVLILYAIATVLGTVAVLMAVVIPTAGFLLFGVTIVMAAVGLYKLGYLREYIRPQLVRLGRPGLQDTKQSVETAKNGASGMQEKREETREVLRYESSELMPHES